MGLFFAVLSPAIFGINNYIEKFLLKKNDISPVVLSAYGGIVALIAGVVILLVTGLYPINIKTLLIFLASGFLTTIYLIPYYKALSIDETSRIVPLFQFYPIFVLLLGSVLLQEDLSLIQYIGAALVMGSGFTLSVKKTTGKTFQLSQSFYYMVLSSFIFALAQVLYKFGLEEIPFWNSLPFEAFGIALGAVVILALRNNYKILIDESKKFRKHFFLLIALNELVYIVARYTGYFAISLIPVVIVSILGGLQPLFVLGYGVILSVWFPRVVREAVTIKIIVLKLASILIMLLGTYFIFI